jgi:hypothetical protein
MTQQQLGEKCHLALRQKGERSLRSVGLHRSGPFCAARSSFDESAKAVRRAHMDTVFAQEIRVNRTVFEVGGAFVGAEPYFENLCFVRGEVHAGEFGDVLFVDDGPDERSVGRASVRVCFARITFGRCGKA